MENNTLTNNLPNLETNFIFKGSFNSLENIKNPKLGDVCSISKDKNEYETYAYIGNNWVLIWPVSNISPIKEELNSITKAPIEETQEDQSYLDLGSKEIERLLRG